MSRITNKRNKPLLLPACSALIAFALVSGCSSSGSSDSADAGTADAGTADGGATGTVGAANCPALQGSADTSSIAGLYDFTETDEIDGEDVYYFQVDSSGNLTDYDYQGDEFDGGDNCYIISTGDSVLSAVTGTNMYTSVFYDDADFNCDTDTEELTIVRNDQTVSVSFVDTFDEDEDGDTTDTITETYNVLTGLGVESFNACP